MTLDAETRRLVRETQLAWLARWLDGEEARRTWVRMVGQGVEMILASPPAALVEEAAVSRFLAETLASESLVATIAPAVVAAVADASLRVREWRESPRGLAGDTAAKAIERMAELPEVVSEAVVRAIVTSPAVETLVSAHVFEALDGFSRRVNPFVAEWGLPALLGALPLLGRATIKAAVAGVQQEFERRLEPETRRFLAVFVKESLERAARDVTTNGHAPEQVRLRKEVAAAVMRVPLREFVWSPDSELGEHALAAIRASVHHVLGHPTVREAVEGALHEVLAETATVRDILARHGIAVPSTEAFAEATFPTVKGILALPEVQDELGRRIDESLS